MLSKEVTESSKGDSFFLSKVLKTNPIAWRVRNYREYNENKDSKIGIDVADDAAEDAGGTKVLLNGEISKVFDTS